MNLRYTPVTVVYRSKAYNSTCTILQAKNIFLTVSKPERYIFIFDNWDGDELVLLVISKSGASWILDEASAIKDPELAEAAGKTIENLQ